MMDPKRRVAAITQTLQAKLKPQTLHVIDDSENHLGHAGSLTGKGHFIIEITLEDCQDLPRLAQHRLIYDALGSLMATDIHALQIKIIPALSC